MWLLLLFWIQAGDTSPQDQFWANLESMCGKRYGGTIEVDRTSNPFEGKPVIHVKACSGEKIQIAFAIGEDRSRTWIITRTPEGLRLKHDHRHKDGTPDKITNYGGDTTTAGTGQRQAFQVDTFTTQLVAGTDQNIWVLEAEAGNTYAYELYKNGKPDPVFRVSFDLSKAL